MAPDEANEHVRGACRKFLNTRAGRNLDPESFIDQLLRAKVIDSDDADIVRSQPTSPHRQNAFFLRILPLKGQENILAAVDVFQSSGRAGALELADSIASTFDSIDAVSRKFLSFAEAKRVDTEAVQEEFIAKSHVSEQTVESGTSGVGSAGDQVVTPEGLQELAGLPIDESQLNGIDIEMGKVIGNGAFAVVHIGTYSGQQVAVKKFISYDNFALTMFMAEVSIMKNLSHPNLLKFIGYVQNISDKQLWLLTEFISGGAMRRFCQRDPALPLGDKLKIAIDCWTGLAYLHGRKCCHKDISPNNILVSSDLSRVKIADFGLSEFKTLMATAVTEVKGTAMYQPPEFACAGGTTAMRHPSKSDVYSMGASLCELFSEQYFWHIGGRPRISMQVCCKLLQQRECVDANLPPCDPDCWSDLPELVRPALKDAINPDYKKRKNAAELKEMTEDLLKSSY